MIQELNMQMKCNTVMIAKVAKSVEFNTKEIKDCELNCYFRIAPQWTDEIDSIVDLVHRLAKRRKAGISMLSCNSP